MSNPTEVEDDSITIGTVFKDQITQLQTDNEKYRQDIYSLEGKLRLCNATEIELQETNESLEKIIAEQKVCWQQKIHELDEKHDAHKRELTCQLNDVESELIKKTAENRELQEKLKQVNEKISSMINEPVVATDTSQTEDIITLQDKIDELMQQLDQEKKNSEQLEQIIKALKNEMCELRDILKVTKEQLAEQNKTLEITRDELTECRIERDSLKVTPASDTCKGNSLFAEVEDRRLKVYDTLNSMKQSYYEIKKTLHIKDAEIKALKTEYGVLLNKWKSDNSDTIEQNANLIHKYKGRISELENKLRVKKLKIDQLEKQMTPSDDAYSFFLSELTAKKKEVGELEAQLEDISIQALLQEEIKHKAHRQLRYWRNIAMTSKAQIEAIKSYCEINSSPIKSDILKILQQNYKDKDSFAEEQLDISEKVPAIENESVVTLEQLITMPKTNSPDQTDNSDKLFHLIDDSRMTESYFSKVCQDTDENTVPSSSESYTFTSSRDLQGKREKKLRFAADIIDPEPRKALRQATTKYPIINVASESSDE